MKYFAYLSAWRTSLPGQTHSAGKTLQGTDKEKNNNVRQLFTIPDWAPIQTWKLHCFLHLGQGQRCKWTKAKSPINCGSGTARARSTGFYLLIFSKYKINVYFKTPSSGVTEHLQGPILKSCLAWKQKRFAKIFAKQALLVTSQTFMQNVYTLDACLFNLA